MFKRALLTLLMLLMPVYAFAAKTVFVDGNAATKTPGTRVTAAYLNAVNTHRHDGKAVDGSGVLDYATATGTANALAITLSPALTAHVDGMPIYIKIAADNTGGVTLAVNALAPVPVYKNVNQTLQAGDLKAGQIIGVSYTGSAYQLLNYQSQDASTVNGQTAAQLSPPGMVAPFYMSACPTGWLELDGHDVSRTTYSALYSAIGTIGGVGNGSTTFNLPDVRGYFFRAWDNGRNVDSGRVFGSTQPDELKSHTHTIDFNGHTSDGTTGGGRIGSGAESLEDIIDFDTLATGGTETRPKNIAVLYCIKY